MHDIFDWIHDHPVAAIAVGMYLLDECDNDAAYMLGLANPEDEDEDEDEDDDT